MVLGSGCTLMSSPACVQMNRSFLLSANEPLLILGATDDWAARESWGLEQLLASHAGAIYHSGPTASATLGSLLSKDDSSYHVGHMNLAHDCYNWTSGYHNKYFPDDRSRRYSPFFKTVASDYQVPPYLLPLRAFQIAVGRGVGVGVHAEERACPPASAIHTLSMFSPPHPDRGSPCLVVLRRPERVVGQRARAQALAIAPTQQAARPQAAHA